jgi:hypothetical protein
MDGQFDPTKPVQCFPYSFDLLCALLSEAGKTPVESTRAKLHLTYLEEYLGHFQDGGRLTIVVEWRYTDRDYLEDYASYYVRCFGGKYLSTCVRLHFFLGELDEKILHDQLSRPRVELEAELNRRYLGFLVVKPIPHTFVGRTCLRTYDDVGRRFFPVTRKCDAHVLGLDLQVESLAYKEQDTVAAACATSALWSVLHATALLFQHRVYTPVEITRIATEKFPTLGRNFPNAGLTPAQIAAAVRGVGLEPEVLAVRNKAQLQSTAYAYLRAGIPCLLIARLFDVSDPGNPMPYDNDWESTHAVAVTGYSMGKAESEPYPDTDALLRSSRLDKLYAHDDQVGPFSRLEFDGPCLKVDLGGGHLLEVDFTMRSSWRVKKGKIGSVAFAPGALIVPVYHKIRVEFDLILHRVLRADEDEDFRKMIADGASPSVGSKDLEWDVFLTSASQFKKELRDCIDLPHDEKWAHLERPLPRFLWRATCYLHGARGVDILYDATDIAQSTSLEVARLRYHAPERE